MTTPLVAHAEALASIGADQDAVIAKDIGGLFTGLTHPDFPDIARQAVPQIVGQHAGAAGLIAAQWYDELDPASSFRARPHSDVDIGEIEKTVNWALFAPGDEPAQSRLTTASQRLVRNVTRNTVTKNAEDEGVLWARHARPEACSFCRILAGRGIGRSDRKGLYESEFIAIFQGAKGSHPGEKYHRHCVPAGTLVSGPRTEAAYRRLYEGEAVVIHTATGQKLTITPNHPVLTDQGWVPAGLLQCGDNVVRSRFGDAGAAAVPYEYQQPALIEDVWGALAMSMLARMPGTAKDFHGDGCDSEVDVVWADGGLGAWREAAVLQIGRQLSLTRRQLGGVDFASTGRRTALFEGSLTTTHRVMGRGRQPGALVGACAAHTNLAGFLGPSGLDAQLQQTSANCGAGGAETIGHLQFGEPLDDIQVMDHIGIDVNPGGPRFDPAMFDFADDGRDTYARLGSDLVDRLTGQVNLDSVIHLDRISLRDHVYNLQTEQGWYSANGILVSNCHCTPVPVRAGQRYEPPDYVLEWDEDYQRAVKALKGRGITSTSGPKRGQAGYDPDWWLKQVVAEMEGRQREEQAKMAPTPKAPEPVLVPEKISLPELPTMSPEVDAKAVALQQLDDAHTLLDVVHAANNVLPDTNVDIRSRDADVEQIKHAVHAVDDVMSKYTDLFPLNYLQDDTIDPDTWAQTRSLVGGLRSVGMVFNKTWLDQPDHWKTEFEDTVSRGFHNPGTGNSGYDTAIHELGHVIEAHARREYGIRIGIREVVQALLDRDIGLIEAKQEGWEAYGAWLEANLSGYSLKHSAGVTVIEVPEALAEAFADVEINADNAKDANKALYQLLIDAYHGIQPAVVA